MQAPLLDQLATEIRSQIAEVTRLKSLDPEYLIRQARPGSWSALQVLEHLNSYSRFYLPEIDRAIRTGKPSRGSYKPGVWGQYFVRLIQTADDGTPVKKMKAARRHRPHFAADLKPVIAEFLHSQTVMLELLSAAAEIDLGKARTRVSIAGWLRLRLGDCLRFQVAHQHRHLLQLQRAVAVQMSSEKKLSAPNLLA